VTASVRYAVEMGHELRRRALIDVCRSYARRARRARLVAYLEETRQIGEQLAALDVTTPEARDVLRAGSHMLLNVSRRLEAHGA
jgi:hypothetical protein